MAKSVNKVILVGNLGKDPEVKFTPSGVPVAKFSLATNERYKDKGGEWQDRTEWHNIVAWQRLAEIVGEYVKKGSKIYIEGRLQTSSWEDKQSGEKKYRTEIVASDLVLLGGRGERVAETMKDVRRVALRHHLINAARILRNIPRLRPRLRMRTFLSRNELELTGIGCKLGVPTFKGRSPISGKRSQSKTVRSDRFKRRWQTQPDLWRVVLCQSILAFRLHAAPLAVLC